MILKFTGPEGASFAGHEIPMVGLDEARLDTVAALQRGTGLKMKDIVEQAQSTEMDGLQMTVFLSLHEAKHKVSWETVQSLQMKDFETVAEPGDDLDAEQSQTDEPDDGSDPTVPASAPDAAADVTAPEHSRASLQ